jgi:nucleotide-binding universal stress UspA family protein
MNLKNILLPVDFSDCAKKACHYAFSLFKGEDCKFFLLNVYEIKADINNMHSALNDIIKEETIIRLNQETEEFKRLYDKENFVFESIALHGDLIIIMDKLTLKHQIDLIIMGTSGKRESEESENGLGSNTAAAIQYITIPIIAVPESHFSFQLKKIVFAINKKVTDTSLFAPIIELSKKYNSVVQILHVSHVGEFAAKSINHLGLNGSLNGVNHNFNFIDNDDVYEGIQQFIEDQHPDMLVMIAGKNSFFHRIFHKSLTTKVALHSHVPLLAIHDLKQP